jgi:hypothetical protein
LLAALTKEIGETEMMNLLTVSIPAAEKAYKVAVEGKASGQYECWSDIEKRCVTRDKPREFIVRKTKEAAS